LQLAQQQQRREWRRVPVNPKAAQNGAQDVARWRHHPAQVDQREADGRGGRVSAMSFRNLGVSAVGSGISVPLVWSHAPWFAYVITGALAMIAALATTHILCRSPQESAHRLEDNRDRRRYQDRKRRERRQYRLEKRRLELNHACPRVGPVGVDRAGRFGAGGQDLGQLPIRRDR
jgi:hypothetical protein